jgi:hypothetical protein
LEGLFGILKSKSLFATHIRYLNDKSEFEHGRRILIDFLADKLGLAAHAAGTVSVTPDELTNFLVSTMLEVLEHESRISEIYSSSFCGAIDQYEFDNGLLSQWRAYGPDGGVCIGFNREKIKAFIQAFGKSAGLTGITLEKVAYCESAKAQSEYLEATYVQFADALKTHALAIHKYVEGKAKAKESLSNSADESGFLAMLVSLFRLLPMLKHVAFHEEKETRIVLCGNTFQEMATLLGLRKFRLKGDLLVPYIEIGGNDQLPVERIVVGPHLEQSRRAQGIKAYTRSVGYKVEVLSSNTPT